MNFLKNKGFTLIELLVVIAIIGVLSTVILGSLGNARNAAKDALIKSELSQMRAQAEVQALETGDYTNICNAGTASGAMFRDAYSNAIETEQNKLCMDEDGTVYGKNPENPPSSTSAGGYGIDSQGNIWAAMVALSDGTWFCVDSSGSAVISNDRRIVSYPSPTNTDKTCN